MSRLGRIGLLSLLVAGAFALLACGGDDTDDGDASATATEDMSNDETTVDFTLADFEITGPTTAPAGAVRFEATNEGSQPHELVIVRSDAEPDALPIVDARVPEDDLDIVGEIEEFPAGEERASAFTLDAGRYLLICNIAGHYQLGMVSVLTVE